MKLYIVLSAIIIATCSTARSQRPETKSPSLHPVKISISVEQERPGGLFVQAGEDLSVTELNSLRSSVEKSITSIRNHRVVPDSDTDIHLILSVVAAKLRGQREWFIASSSLGAGTLSGHLDSLTHDVIAEPDIPSLARAVAYYLSAAELHGFTGDLENRSK
jgi:hypothetical protein